MTQGTGALGGWRIAGVVATTVIVLAMPLHLAVRALRKPRVPAPTAALYVGSGSCRDCHAREYQSWQGSHHALAMLAPRPGTVLGDFGGVTFRERGKSWTFSTRDGRYFVR
ncbi:MAG TPA: multiheme c-type cytochrome, partial [Spirochaetia bacterium]|nr:multiheme c-type cytochrome [Spirochaetia bacterium]